MEEKIEKQIPAATHRFSVPSLGAFEVEYYRDKAPRILDPKIFPPHIHDTIELYILVDGNVSFMVENHLYDMKSGDIILAKPNEIHHCIHHGGSVHKHFCLNFRPSSDLLFGPFLSHAIGSGNLISPPPEEKEKILAICEDFLTATEEHESDLTKYALAVSLLAKIAENIRPAKEGEKAESDVPSVLKCILDELNVRFTEADSLGKLCEAYYISGSTLNRLFRKYLHTTPRHYLETKRLAYSRLLLCQGKNVTEACIGAGFSDCSGYIRLFRARFGMTPLQYKMSHAEPLSMRLTTKKI